MSPADAVRMLRLCRQQHPLDLKLGRFLEAAKLTQAKDQPASIIDRRLGGEAEIFGFQFVRYRGEVGPSKFNHVFVFAPVELHLLKNGAGGNAKAQIPKSPSEFQSARTS